MLKASVQLYKNAYQGIPKPVWLLSLVMLVNRSGTMVIPFLTVYLVNSGYTLTQAGFVMTMFGIGAIVGGFLGGKLTDKYGFYHTQLFCLFLNGLFFILLGFMSSLWQIAICIFVLSSVGEGFRPANAAAIAAYTTDDNRTRSYALNRLATNLGWAIGPAIGGILAGINFKLLFWVDGLTCIFASFLLYTLSQKTQSSNSRTVKERDIKVASAYKDKHFLKGMLAMFLIGVTFFQMFSLFPVFYKENVHLPEQLIGIILALNGLIIVAIEMILVYKLEGKKPSLYYMTIGAFLIGVSFLTLTISPVLAIVLLSMLVITIGEMFLFPFANNFWVDRTNENNRGQYAALYTITFAIGQVIAPVFGSYVAMHFQFNTLFVMDFALCSVGAIGFFLLNKQKTNG